MAIYLSLRWFHLFLTLLLLGPPWQAYSAGVGVLAWAVGVVVLLFFTIGYFVLAERAAQGFRPLAPLFCSLYDPRFWRHERFWKMIAPPIVMAFSGTPYKNVVMRLAGVRVGRRVFDDGCFLPEKTLVEHRRRLHPQHRDGGAVPLHGGGRVQARRHHDRGRGHARCRRLRPLLGRHA